MGFSLARLFLPGGELGVGNLIDRLVGANAGATHVVEAVECWKPRVRVHVSVAITGLRPRRDRGRPGQRRKQRLLVERVGAARGVRPRARCASVTCALTAPLSRLRSPSLARPRSLSLARSLARSLAAALSPARATSPPPSPTASASHGTPGTPRWHTSLVLAPSGFTGGVGPQDSTSSIEPGGV